MSDSNSRTLKACHCCGQIQWIEPVRPGPLPGSAVSKSGIDEFRTMHYCARCGILIGNSGNSSARRSRTAAAAISALALFPAAVLLPILEIEKLGYRHQTSILGGISDLFSQGNLLIAVIILSFSIILPLLKLLTLVELCWLRWLEHHHRAFAFRLVEFSGRWSMLDVMLLALLVMCIKLSGLVSFQLGPAVFAFAGCVILSMVSSMSFDPHSIWDDE